MSEQEPDGPYIYQPFGMQRQPHWDLKRIYGISGISPWTIITGLRKEEAEKILSAISSPDTIVLPRKMEEIKIWAERGLKNEDTDYRRKMFNQIIELTEQGK